MPHPCGAILPHDRNSARENAEVLREFKEFLLRGNVVDIAVGIIIGVAFAAVVTALVEDLITPLIAAIGGNPDFGNLDFHINGSTFLYGDFINKLITFVIIAAVVFFFVVKPINTLIERTRRTPPMDPTTKRCPQCLSEVPLAASRCAFCTSDLSATGAPAR
jgi:large conductance mechanosensitive channel